MYSLITIPVVFVLALIVDKSKRLPEIAWPIWVGGGLLYSIVYMIDKFLVIGIITTIAFAIGYAVVQNPALKKNMRLTFWLGVVALIGFSTHAYIPIRSSLNPIIDENNPEIALTDVFKASAWKPFNDFVGRKQYGSESMLKRSFHRRGKLGNQVLTFPHMGYGGYQFAQYFPWKVGEVRFNKPGEYQIPLADNEPVTRGSTEFPTQMTFMGDQKLPQFVIFGIMNGMLLWICWLIYKRNEKLGWYIFLLLIVTSAGLIFYMNFADGTQPERYVYERWVQGGKNGVPQPVHLEVRDRDYFFSPAFILMSVVYGLGAALLINFLRVNRRKLLMPAAISLVVVAYAVPCFSNYKEHNRAGLYVPWDYAYNLISSCEPNGILFTNGDNDTFPLWFIQEVANVRKDVRVINLSLGNTKWYIHQLLDNEPKVKLSYTHEDIEKFLNPTFDKEANGKKAAVASGKLKAIVINALAEIDSLKKVIAESSDVAAKVKLDKSEKDLPFKFRNYLAISGFGEWASKGGQGMLKIQDKLVLDVTRQNPNRPIHFATTVSVGNYIGLEKYMKMDGMVYTLVDNEMTPSSRKLDVVRTQALIDSVYQFRGLGDGTCYINPESARLMNNYNSMYIHVAFDQRGKIEKLQAQKPLLVKQQLDAVDNTKSAEEITASIDADIEAKIVVAKKYLDMGMTQFPNEWRSYAVMSDILNSAKKYDEAISYVNRGLAVANPSEKSYLTRQKLSTFDAANKTDEALAFIETAMKDPDLDKNLLLQFKMRFESKKK